MAPQPPIAMQIEHLICRHGDQIVDEYHWLSDEGEPAVKAYLKEEQAYTEAVMAETKQLQKRLYDEMLSRIREDDQSVPEKLGDCYYYTRHEKGKSYAIHCRKRGSLDAQEEVLLNENKEAFCHKYFHVEVWRISPHQDLLMFSVDTKGSGRYTLRVKNLRTSQMLPDSIDDTYDSAEWANDNRTVFYTVLDESDRPYRLCAHVLGTDVFQDAVLYEEKDPAFHLSLSKSSSRKYLLVEAATHVTSEVHVLDLEREDAVLKLFSPRRQDVRYSVDHNGDSFFILTNDEAKNYRLMKTRVSTFARDCWTEVISHQEAVMLERVTAFACHLVLLQREHGVRQIQIRRLADHETYTIDLPEQLYSVDLEWNPEFDTSLLRFSYSSFITPTRIYDYDMDTRRLEMKKEDDVLGGYDRSLYQSERIWAAAADGAQVPILLTYRRDRVADGLNPLLLYGYGAYGDFLEAEFDSDLFSLLDRGFVYAVAQVRGGAELGRQWYDDGRLLNKQNTFSDFVRCAEHLCEQGYTAPDRLAIYGRSAGGLLIGAVLNQRPELFRVAVSEVPFVDVINTMSDPTLPAVVTERYEWGDPRDEQQYRYMRCYSPYDNVAAQNYPNLLVVYSKEDRLVSYWEPVKWVAKLRCRKTDQNDLLLEDVGSHGGASGRYDQLKESAFVYAFVLDHLPD